MNVSGGKLLGQSVEELAAQHGLSYPHLAGDLDKPLTASDGYQQHIESVLVTGPVHEKSGIRGDGERQMTHVKMFEIHGVYP